MSVHRKLQRFSKMSMLLKNNKAFVTFFYACNLSKNIGSFLPIQKNAYFIDWVIYTRIQSVALKYVEKLMYKMFIKCFNWWNEQKEADLNK